MEFPDRKIKRSPAELDEVGGEMLREFSSSDAIERAGKILYWFRNDSRNVASVVKVSYVIAEKCSKSGRPGVIVYWSK